MGAVIGFLVGAAVASVAWFLIARNNKKKVAEVLKMDPSVEWDRLVDKIKAEIKEKL